MSPPGVGDDGFRGRSAGYTRSRLTATLTLIGGAVITEYVFALPGVGRLVVDAVFARDYPLVQGVVVLLIAIGFIVSNLIVDVLYGWIDPRIRSR